MILSNSEFDFYHVHSYHSFTVLAAGIAATSALLTGLLAAKANKDNVSDTNATNKQINDDSLAYNKEVQEKTWEREDSAWQRGVADAEAAGLSPLSVTSGSTSGSIAGAPSAIPMQADNSASILNDAMQSSINSMYQGAALDLQKKQFDAKQKQDDDHFRASLQRDYDAMDETKQRLQMQIDATSDENEKRRLQEASQFHEQLSETIREFNLQFEESKHQFDQRLTEERFDKYQQALADRIKQVTGGKGKFQTYDDYAKYQAAMSEYTARLRDYIEVHIGRTSESQAFGDSSSASFGLNASASSQAGLGSSASQSGSQSFSHSENNSQYNDAMLRAFFEENPCPVYTGDIEYRSYSRS